MDIKKIIEGHQIIKKEYDIDMDFEEATVRVTVSTN